MLLQKNLLLKKILSYGIIAFLAYIPFHPFFTAWVGSLTDVYAPIKIWKDVVVAVVAVALVSFSVMDKLLRRVVWRDPLNLVILSYVLLHFLFFLSFANFSEESSYAGLIFNLRFFAAFMVVRIAIVLYPGIESSLMRVGIKVMLIGALLVSAIAILQLLVPTQGVYEFFGYDGVNTISPVALVDNDPNAPRAFSTLRGPNELGSYMILPLTVAAVFILYGYRRWYIFAAFVILLLSLVGSYSRSALIGSVIALSIATVIYYGRRISRRHQIASVVTVTVTAALLVWVSVTVPAMRLFIFHSSPGDASLFEGSTEDHFRATGRGITDVVENPSGRGPGESGPASFYQTDDAPRIPENYYVQIAQEVGIIGSILFLAILVMVGRRLFMYRHNPLSLAMFAAFIGIGVANMFLHSWADDPTAYVWWILAGAVLGYNERNSWIKSKDSSRSKT